jgi:fatty acid desaturase
MESTNKSAGILFVILELLFGVILSFIFIKFALNNDNDDLWGETIADGIIRIYGVLSLIFFFSVFLVGIIGAIKLKRSNKIGKAISYSILFWLLSLIASALLAQFGGISALYVVLVGIVVGFNIGLGHNSQKEVNDSEISN